MDKFYGDGYQCNKVHYAGSFRLIDAATGGYYFSRCGMVSLHQSVYEEYTTDHDATCGNCLKLVKNDKADKLLKHTDHNKVMNGHLATIKTAMEVVLNIAVDVPIVNPLGVKIVEKVYTDFLEDKTLDEFFSYMSKEILRQLLFKDGTVTIKANPEIAALIHMIPLVMNRLMLAAMWNEKCAKETYRRKICKNAADGISEANEHTRELERDLTEAEEANVKLITENDELRNKVNKVNDLINS